MLYIVKNAQFPIKDQELLLIEKEFVQLVIIHFINKI